MKQQLGTLTQYQESKSIEEDIPARHAEILLMPILLTMFINSLQYINVGNLIGLREAMYVTYVRILQRFTGIQGYTSIMNMQPYRRYSVRLTKTTQKIAQKHIFKG